MTGKTQLVGRLLLASPIILCGFAPAQTVVSSARPVADAILTLEKLYGWPITYEDPPYAYSGDLEDATSRVRKDHKSAGDGVLQILLPRVRTISFPAEDVARPAVGTRAPETSARSAILAMLKSYSDSVGAEMFTLTDSDGLFHVIPVRRKDAEGRLEKITPLLDTPLSISSAPTVAVELVNEIFRFLTGPAGTRAFLFTTWAPATTHITPRHGETARSVLSRLLAEQSGSLPISWALLYEPSWGYMLHLHGVDTSRPRAAPR